MKTLALQCKFGTDDHYCHNVANPDGMCPRHRLMVAEFGQGRAIAMEYGDLCPVCFERYDIDELDRCWVCQTKGVCDDCIADGACCDEKREALDD